MRVSFVDVVDVRTRLYDAGKGSAVLFIHGAGMAADVWLRNIDALANRHRVVAPDLLGNGFTDIGEYDTGPPQPHYVNHLFALMNTLGIERFAAVGSSLGAQIAALMYLEAPDRVGPLVFVGSGSTLTTDESLMASSIKRAYANGRTAFLDMTYEDCCRRMTNIVHDFTNVPESLIMMQLTANSLPGALVAYDTRMTGMMDAAAVRPYRAGLRLAEIEVPALAIIGREDPRGRYEQAMSDFKSLPNGQVVTFEKCGHYPQLEHSDEFNRLLIEFLDGTGENAR